MKIKDLKAKPILDSKGEPTLKVKVFLEDGTQAEACVPSGSSTGKHEALEVRDNNPQKFHGKGVNQAVENVKQLAAFIKGKEVTDQEGVDGVLISLDGTPKKMKFGANAIVGISMAVCRAAANSEKIPLYQYFGQLMEEEKFTLPQPLVLVMEGGKHGNWSTDIQEFFLIPQKNAFKNLTEMLIASKKVFEQLGEILKAENYQTKLGMEGAYCPTELKSNEEAFQLISQAIKKSSYQLGKDFILGIDAAASEFFQEEEKFYILKSEREKKITSEVWRQKLAGWLNSYPLWLIEDPLAEDEWEEWSVFNQQFGQNHEIVADDLTVTNVKRMEKAKQLNACNAVIIKINQIGTVSETLAAIKMAKKNGWATVVSHRSGETMDDFIADLAVGCAATQVKFGGLTKPERMVKYNRLLTIQKEIS